MGPFSALALTCTPKTRACPGIPRLPLFHTARGSRSTWQQKPTCVASLVTEAHSKRFLLQIETTTSEGALLENGQASGGTSDQDEKAAEPTAESKGTGWKRKCEKAVGQGRPLSQTRVRTTFFQLKQARLIQQQLNEEKKRRQEASGGPSDDEFDNVVSLGHERARYDAQ